jgi:hypothetical protein
VFSGKDDSQHESEETRNGWKPSVEDEKLPGLAAGQFFLQVVSEMNVNGIIVLANLCSRRRSPDSAFLKGLYCTMELFEEIGRAHV